MIKKKTNILVTLLVVTILAWLIRDVITQKTTTDLEGGFTEMASYRNENNTGPIQRIYSVTVSDIARADLEAYGNLMPHSKYGNTKVYFFKKGTAAPTKLFPGEINFDSTYAKNCFAVYEKSAMGNFSIVFNPFKQKQKTQ
ncbi:MAG: hypothetical protein EOO07_14350 [Chitinophagaceae bacterium]|nr:MAG: hypothetical protein EOO07_14350 [Chitinophagaceae bacterium]